MPSVSFSCHIAVARTSSATLNKSGNSEYPHFALHLRGKACPLSLLSMMVAVSCNNSIDVLYEAEKVPLYF